MIQLFAFFVFDLYSFANVDDHLFAAVDVVTLLQLHLKVTTRLLKKDPVPVMLF